MEIMTSAHIEAREKVSELRAQFQAMKAGSARNIVSEELDWWIGRVAATQTRADRD